MIRITIDEDIHEADVELVNNFALALTDKDRHMMEEVIYLAWERLDSSCRCYEVTCMCEKV